jgi:hypothetical protein
MKNDQLLNEIVTIVSDIHKDKDNVKYKHFNIGIAAYNAVFYHIEKRWNEYLQKTGKDFEILELFGKSSRNVPYKLADSLFEKLFQHIFNGAKWDRLAALKVLSLAFS